MAWNYWLLLAEQGAEQQLVTGGMQASAMVLCEAEAARKLMSPGDQYAFESWYRMEITCTNNSSSSWVCTALRNRVNTAQELGDEF